jgi:predicted nucleic acid-binding protein
VKNGIKEKQQTGLRVVLDTNVYISALNFPDSPLADLVRHAKRGMYQLKTITKSSEIVMPQTIPNVIKEDPDDNHILACALAGKANLIVSRDLDLLRLKTYETIGIMSPIDFLHTLEGFKKAA